MGIYLLSLPIFQFGLFILLGILYGAVTTAVSRNQFLAEWDVPFGVWVIARNTPLGGRIFSRITDLGRYQGVRLITALTGLGLILYRDWRRLIMLLGIVALAMLVTHYMKIAIPRTRPDFPQNFLYVVSLSYPSGHTMLATSFYLFLAYLGWTYTPVAEIRWLIMGLAFVLIGVIGFSRVYLGVHFLTDVIGGWIAGSMVFIFVLTLSNLLFFSAAIPI